MQVEVTDADREAAARLIALWDDGDLHCDDFTEAFARHRIAERERVVGEVERLEERMGEAYQLAGSIALEHDISGPEVERLLDLLAGSEAKFGGRD